MSLLKVNLPETLDALTTLRWTSLFLGLSQLIQSAEMISIQRSWGDAESIWKWGTLRQEYLHLPKPLLGFVDHLLDEKGYLLSQLGRLLAAGVLIGSFFATLPQALLILGFWGTAVGSLLTSVRWRGAFNGGSDAMNLVVALPLALAVTLGTDSAFAVAYAYITLQVTLSYFIAGWVKVREQEWRTGDALPIFLATPQYAVPEWIAKPLNRSWILSTALSWGVILFELTFPLTLASPRACALALAAALLFHGMNAYILGLNRFVFAWLSAYPGVLLISQLLSHRWATAP